VASVEAALTRPNVFGSEQERQGQLDSILARLQEINLSDRDAVELMQEKVGLQQQLRAIDVRKAGMESQASRPGFAATYLPGDSRELRAMRS
jgi:hypothetical protein